MRGRELRWVALALAAAACDAPPPVTDPSTAITPLVLEGVTLERAGGARVELEQLERPLVLHFWASWCAPCRRELPALLEVARDTDARVLAVSIDAEWAPVRAFFDGAPPPEVVLDPSDDLARTLGLSALPDTYLVDREGRATERIAGTRDWSAPAERAWLARTVEGRQRSGRE